MISDIGYCLTELYKSVHVPSFCSTLISPIHLLYLPRYLLYGTILSSELQIIFNFFYILRFLLYIGFLSILYPMQSKKEPPKELFFDPLQPQNLQLISVRMKLGTSLPCLSLESIVAYAAKPTLLAIAYLPLTIQALQF